MHDSLVKGYDFWVIAPNVWLTARCFGGTYRIYHQIQKAKNQKTAFFIFTAVRT
jgi:hypothetical protein